MISEKLSVGHKDKESVGNSMYLFARARKEWSVLRLHWQCTQALRKTQQK